MYTKAFVIVNEELRRPRADGRPLGARDAADVSAPSKQRPNRRNRLGRLHINDSLMATWVAYFNRPIFRLTVSTRLESTHVEAGACERSALVLAIPDHPPVPIAT
jgi:hypothetical protein